MRDTDPVAARPLTVVINAQLRSSGSVGGIYQFVSGVVRALGRLQDGPERYVIVGPAEGGEWLNSCVGPNMRVVSIAAAAAPRGWKRWLGPVRAPLGQAYRALRPPPPVVEGPVSMPASNGFFESFGAQVVHFPYQQYLRCRLPTIFNPHDLQHHHFPNFFTQPALEWRRTVVDGACRDAAAVAVVADWPKQDVVRQLGVDPGKVFVIPIGSPTEFYSRPDDGRMARVRDAYRLTPQFALYPAQTWPHKNHLRLIEALARLRDEHNIKLHLVCTGGQNDHMSVLQQRIAELKLQEQTQFLGYVPDEDLVALYRLAQFLVFPSLFEAACGPMLEAFCEGLPVAASNVTSLPQWAGDAAMLFDPESVPQMTDALRRMSQEPELRERLRMRGRERLRHFRWDVTARAYRALYRHVAGIPLGDEEKRLLRLPGSGAAEFDGSAGRTPHRVEGH